MILFVEDDEDLRALYEEYFVRAGYRVETAANGNDAIAKAINLLPDFVFMDMAMPGLDGWEATRLIRAYLATRDVPVVAVTAHGDAASVESALEAGCLAVLHKPCAPADLERVLRCALEERSGRRDGTGL